MSDKPDIKLVRALQADFKALYVREFTTSWEAERVVRNLELGVMSLSNTEAYIRKHLEALPTNNSIELADRHAAIKSGESNEADPR